MNDREIVQMSPKLIEGPEYTSLFGIYGALPISFTERILYQSIYANCILFFETCFVSLLINKYRLYLQSTRELIYTFLFFKKTSRQPTRIILSSIDVRNKYNKLSISKLSNFIIGNRFIETTSNDYNPIKCTIGQTTLL